MTNGFLNSMKIKKANYRFPIWLTVIFFGLICIPLLVYLGEVLFAKIFGVSILVITSFALRYWLFVSNSSATRYRKVRLNKNETFELERFFPFYKRLTNPSKLILLDRMGLFLANTPIIDVSGNFLSKSKSIEIVLVLALVFYNLPELEYDFVVQCCPNHEFSKLLKDGKKYCLGDFSTILEQLRSTSFDSDIDSLVNSDEIKKIKNAFC